MAEGHGQQPVNDATSARVVRGGSWGSGPLGLRAAGRSKYQPEFRYCNLGLRLARTIFP
ncbi:SUMF1/EgtB/PvdO family nonheme iron enzyme [uncultured Thiodictyon sp.]|uniref:SUMF1/EgtB/PvdO family nonheme iron enzyme n=1 Tax=uncultured Thiodictyon sp. TaxID=1846217 RepID=UPI00343117AC